LNKKFKDIWATKLPWEKNVVNVDGFVTHVRCKICTKVSRKEKFLEPSKYDYLCKYVGRKKTSPMLALVWLKVHFIGKK
jgi:hypothetical protein